MKFVCDSLILFLFSQCTFGNQFNLKKKRLYWRWVVRCMNTIQCVRVMSTSLHDRIIHTLVKNIYIYINAAYIVNRDSCYFVGISHMGLRQNRKIYTKKKRKKKSPHTFEHTTSINMKENGKPEATASKDKTTTTNDNVACFMNWLIIGDDKLPQKWKISYRIKIWTIFKSTKTKFWLCYCLFQCTSVFDLWFF